MRYIHKRRWRLFQYILNDNAIMVRYDTGLWLACIRKWTIPIFVYRIIMYGSPKQTDASVI